MMKEGFLLVCGDESTYREPSTYVTMVTGPYTPFCIPLGVGVTLLKPELCLPSWVFFMHNYFVLIWIESLAGCERGH